MISTQKSINKLLLPKIFSSNGFQIAKNSTKRVFPHMAPTDDAEKITSEPHGPFVLLTRTCTTQKLKTLRGVPVWYQPNTLRWSSQRNLLFTTLECQSWGEIVHTFVYEGFGVFIIVQSRNPCLDPEVLSLQERTSLIHVSSGILSLQESS